MEECSLGSSILKPEQWTHFGSTGFQWKSGTPQIHPNSKTCAEVGKLQTRKRGRDFFSGFRSHGGVFVVRVQIYQVLVCYITFPKQDVDATLTLEGIGSQLTFTFQMASTETMN